MTTVTAADILQMMDVESSSALEQLEVLAEVDSTNSYLLNQSRPAPGRYRVVVAEHQSAGRGRMDRRWISTPDSAVCLSVSYSFVRPPLHLPCLSLAVGVGIVEALSDLGISAIKLKWPNDLIANERKIGGILMEVVPGTHEFLTVVVGVGLNMNLDGIKADIEACRGIDTVTDLRSCSPGTIDKSVLASAMILGAHRSLSGFASEGFKPFAGSWHRLDWLRGKRVVVDRPEGQQVGEVKGIGNDGALLLATGRGTQRVISGSVRLM